jgi:hypothetical protein
MKKAAYYALLWCLAGVVCVAGADCAERGGTRSSPATAPPGAYGSRTAPDARAATTPVDAAARGAPKARAATSSSGVGTAKRASGAKSPGTGKAAGAKKSGPAKPGLAGFAAFPFPASPSPGAQPEAQKVRRYGPPERQKSETPLTFGDKRNITVSAPPGPATDHAAPGSPPFSGGPERLAHLHDKESPEVDMSYKLKPGTAARIAVNPGDPDSPLYRPPEKTRNLTGAGLYMDMSVSEDMNVTVGGEYCDVHDSRPVHRADGAAGASLGITWNF